eukprot:10251721-Lingulodinium_polyedra.AAC.1
MAAHPAGHARVLDTGGGANEPPGVSDINGEGGRDEAERRLLEACGRIRDALLELEQQADMIGRRAVELDRLPGSNTRPSVVMAILQAIR